MMPVHNLPIETRIRYGERVQTTTSFHQQTSMTEIWQFICSNFELHASHAVQLRVYDTNQHALIILDQQQLNRGFNPFIWTTNTVDLHLVNIGMNNQIQSTLPMETIESLPTATTNTPAASDIDVDALQRYLNEFDPKVDKQNRNGQNETSCSQSVSTASCSLIVRPTQISTQDTGQSQPLLVELPSGALNGEPTLPAPTALSSTHVTRSRNRNEGSLPIHRGAAEPIIIQRQKRTRVRQHRSRSPIQSRTIEQCNTSNFYFCHDVNPIQKDKYLSDEINQNTINKSNGRISCIQGFKVPGQEMVSVKPVIHIPRQIGEISDGNIWIYAVKQIMNEGHFGWKPHPRKYFLPEGDARETVLVNPIVLSLKEILSADNPEHLELKLRMVTYWDKSKTENDFIPLSCSLGINDLLSQHSAPHNETLPRLLCFIHTKNQEPQQYWYCFSNFIQPS